MSYNDANQKIPLPDVAMVEGNSYCINCLSGPYSPHLMGADTQLRDLPSQLGDKFHNNREVALRNAAVVACFRRSGNEVALNERLEDALSMPPLVDTETFLSPLLSNFPDATLGNAVEVMAPSVPGIDREGVYTSTVFGTNAPARRSSGALPGGTGKVVWYKVEVPDDGKCRVGVRPFGTAPGLNPVVAVWNEAGQAMQGKVLTGQAAAAEGYLYAVEIEAAKGMQLNIAVDSGNAEGGQFSLVAQLTPRQGGAVGPASPGGGNEPMEDDDDAAAAAIALMMLFLAFAGGAGAMWLLMRGRKAAPAVVGIQRNPYSLPDPPQGFGLDEKSWAVKPPEHQSGDLVLQCIFPDGSSHAYNVSMHAIAEKHNFYIGRKAISDLCIPESSISGCHAVLKVRRLDAGKPVLLVGDAGSTNGTWIDGRRLTGDNCAKVKAGSELVLGKVKATISIHS